MKKLNCYKTVKWILSALPFFSHLDSNMPLCYSAIPSRSLRSACQLMISGGDVKAVQGATLVQAAPVEAEPTISVSALLELLKDADPSVKAQFRLALLT
ncbi:MAG: hypothetical protein ACLRHM_06945 [Faecalibacterium sp.]